MTNKKEPRNCPFCNDPPTKERNLFPMFGKYTYWCNNGACRLGRTEVKFRLSEWQGKD